MKNEGALNGPEDFTCMEKIINISGQDFQLGMVNMWDRSRSHHTSLHYVNDQFVYNDGKNCQPFPLISNKKIFYGSHSVCENVLEHKDLKFLKTNTSAFLNLILFPYPSQPWRLTISL